MRFCSCQQSHATMVVVTIVNPSVPSTFNPSRPNQLALTHARLPRSQLARSTDTVQNNGANIYTLETAKQTLRVPSLHYNHHRSRAAPTTSLSLSLSISASRCCSVTQASTLILWTLICIHLLSSKIASPFAAFIARSYHRRRSPEEHCVSCRRVWWPWVACWLNGGGEEIGLVLCEAVPGPARGPSVDLELWVVWTNGCGGEEGRQVWTREREINREPVRRRPSPTQQSISRMRR